MGGGGGGGGIGGGVEGGPGWGGGDSISRGVWRDRSYITAA